MKRILKNKQAVAGIIIILFVSLTALFANFLVPNDPYRQNIFNRYENPQGIGGEYILGTDNLGRCVFSRIIMGTRASRYVGLVAVSISLTIGVILGLMAGYIGGRIDEVIMRLMDLILAFPAILLAIFIVAVLGPSLFNAMLAIAIVRIPQLARVTRSQVLALKEEDFVMAARALGAGHLRIIFRHILINSFAPLLVIISLGMGLAIVTEAALSFLGLGTQPPDISWGRMLSVARDAIRTAPHVATYTGIAIVITTLGFNLLGDGLRDVFDPRLK